MRVIAGELKGRRLKTPKWEGLRPTSDKLRETLFNVVAQRVAGARVLDMYAGTGAIGIEALSRGAAHVTFIDFDARALKLIAENLRHCGAEDREDVEALGEHEPCCNGGERYSKEVERHDGGSVGVTQRVRHAEM